MRALWSVVVVCLVAASGVAPADARTEPGTASLRRPAAGILATRPVVHLVAGRSRTPDVRPSALAGLPLAVVTAAFAVPPPPRRAIAHAHRSCTHIALPLILTCSARGPPIA